MVPTRELCVQVTRDLHRRRPVPGEPASPRSTAVGRTNRRSARCARASTWSSAPPAGCSTWSTRATSTSARSPSSCSTRPTRCSTSASCPTSSGSWPGCRTQRQTMLFSRDHARPDRRAGPPLHAPADAHPRRAADEEPGRCRRPQQFVYRAHALDKVEMLARDPAGRRPRADDDLLPDQAAPRRRSPTSWSTAASRPRRCTATSGRGRASRRCARSGPARSTCWSPPTWRPAGIDVEGVTHVVNYQCPEDEKTYLHRIGRTGRAGASGVAVTFVDWDDVARWSMISEALVAALPLARGDLLDVRAPLRRPGDRRRGDRDAAPVAPDPGRPGRRGGRGPRRDRAGSPGAAGPAADADPAAGRVGRRGAGGQRARREPAAAQPVTAAYAGRAAGGRRGRLGRRLRPGAAGRSAGRAGDRGGARRRGGHGGGRRGRPAAAPAARRSRPRRIG